MNPEYEQQVHNEIVDGFENWYGGWILTHPAYWAIQGLIKPAMAYAYFQGCIYASDRMEAKLDEIVKADNDFPD